MCEVTADVKVVRVAQRCDPQKLREQLATEHPVVLQFLVTALVFVGAPRGDLETVEQILPEIGHPPSVSQLLSDENLILARM